MFLSFPTLFSIILNSNQKFKFLWYWFFVKIRIALNLPQIHIIYINYNHNSVIPIQKKKKKKNWERYRDVSLIVLNKIEKRRWAIAGRRNRVLVATSTGVGLAADYRETMSTLPSAFASGSSVWELDYFFSKTPSFPSKTPSFPSSPKYAGVF